MKSILNNKILTYKIQKQYIKSLEKKGIKFIQTSKYWQDRKTKLSTLVDVIENKDIRYPKYFTKPIHAYENGHLNWEHAFHSKCHMQASAIMSIKDIVQDSTNTTPIEAYEIYKDHIISNIEKTIINPNIQSIVDLGCGTGELTYKLAEKYKSCEIYAVDLSPYYLSIALHNKIHENITYHHDNIENVNITNNSQDVVTICYVFHEMTISAIKNTLRNAYRLLKYDGQIIIIDMNPETIPSYPSFIDFSEPHLKEYRNVDMLDYLKQSSFENCSERHLHKNSYIFIGYKLKL